MAFSSLEMQKRLIQTLREKCPDMEFFLVRIWTLFTLWDHSILLGFFTPSGKETLTSLRKLKLQKTFSPVCTLLVELASMIVFYSIWWMEGINFYKSLSLVLFFFSFFFQLLCYCFLWKNCFKRSPYFTLFPQKYY